jgi:hypothetical protein
VTRIFIFLLCLVPTNHVAAERYRVHVETSLETDDWYSRYGYDVRKNALSHRIQLDVFPSSSSRISQRAAFDLRLGMDLGREPDEAEQPGAVRRTQLDLYRAEWQLPPLLPNTRITLGRQPTWDVLGMGSFDGVTVRINPLPWLHLRTRGGFGLQHHWQSVGPTLPTPIASDSKQVGYVIGAGIRMVPSTSVEAELAYHRQFDTHVQRDELGWLAAWKPIKRVSFQHRAIVDLVFGAMADVGLRLVSGWSYVDAAVGISYLRPRFSSDSIWVAFAPVPHHMADAELRIKYGPWNLSTGAESKRFQDLNGIDTGLLQLGPNQSENQAFAGYASLMYHWGPVIRPGVFGIHGRASQGFGGNYETLAFRLKTPTGGSRSLGRFGLENALGLAWFEQHHDSMWNGGSAWTRIAIDWSPDEGVLVDIATDVFAGLRVQERIRFSINLTMENLW